MKDDRIRDEPVDPSKTDVLQEEVRGERQYDPTEDPDTKGPLERASEKLSDALGGDHYPQQGEVS